MPDRAKVYHREKTFYDNTSLENEGNFPYKGGATRAAEQTFFTFLGDLKGKTVLEYGCGTGKQLITLARAGAHAIGIELSPTRAKQANQSVKNLTLNNASVVLMNAEQLGFADESFDLICGGAILHHLELSTTMREIKRVLAPNGFAVFLEPLGKNPLIRLYRKKTPALRTPDERPLVDADIEAYASDHASYRQTAFRNIPISEELHLDSCYEIAGQKCH